MTLTQKTLVAAALLLAGASGSALADSAGVIGPGSFPQREGQALYATICQGCHMPDGKGATGAGAYPALAANRNLEGSGYPLYLVLYGQKAMPGFGGFLDDAQVAEIVNYIRTNFGNEYKDQLTAEDVKSARQTGYQYFTLD